MPTFTPEQIRRLEEQGCEVTTTEEGKVSIIVTGEIERINEALQSTFSEKRPQDLYYRIIHKDPKQKNTFEKNLSVRPDELHGPILVIGVDEEQE